MIKDDKLSEQLAEENLRMAMLREVDRIDEIARLQSELEAVKAERDSLKRDLEHYERFACKTCGGSGYVGSPPDDYYSCPECNVPIQQMADELRQIKSAIPQIQAKAIDEAVYVRTQHCTDWLSHDDIIYVSVSGLKQHAQNILDKAGE